MPSTLLKTDGTLDVDALLAFHHGLHGDARMEADGDGGDDAGDGDDTADGDKPDGDKSDDDADGKDSEAEARIKKANDQAAARRRELKPWKDLATEFGMTPEQVREALKNAPKGGKGKAGDDKGDDETVDADAIRREARIEANKAANARIVGSEVRALAADLFKDPADAPLYLDLSKYDVDDDGNVDAEEIKTDLKAVLDKKPHLARKGSKPKPDSSQGPRGGSGAETKPGLDRMRAAYASSKT